MATDGAAKEAGSAVCVRTGTLLVQKQAADVDVAPDLARPAWTTTAPGARRGRGRVRILSMAPIGYAHRPKVTTNVAPGVDAQAHRRELSKFDTTRPTHIDFDWRGNLDR